MIELNEYAKRKIGVLGLGKTGISVIRSLNCAKLVAWDDDLSIRSELINNKNPYYVSLNLANIITDPSSFEWEEIEFLVISPGISIKGDLCHPLIKLAKSLNKKIICDLDLLYSHCPQSFYVGITGTNGKSTTTKLIGHILSKNQVRAQVGGNIGVAALELEPLAINDTYILELSSYQLALIDKIYFNIAILLNITKDHIEHHGSFEEYIKAKEKIFQNQSKDDVAIIGIDTKEGANIYQKLRSQSDAKIIPISTNEILEYGVSVIGGFIHYNIEEESMTLKLDELVKLPGKHNGENIAAAFVVAMYYQINPQKILDSIVDFPGIKHRIQHVATIDRIKFINDSKATNYESTTKALAIFDNIYLIAGGLAKEGDIDQLIPYFSKIKHMFLVGRDRDLFTQMAIKHHITHSNCMDLEKAVNLAFEIASKEKDDVVILLSPACSSLDQWKNFEERGDAFCNYVKNLSKQ
jgi:UDP-N-acetylmuramoylalanine--D-glutamate ligase